MKGRHFRAGVLRQGSLGLASTSGLLDDPIVVAGHARPLIVVGAATLAADRPVEDRTMRMIDDWADALRAFVAAFGIRELQASRLTRDDAELLIRLPIDAVHYLLTKED